MLLFFILYIIAFAGQFMDARTTEVFLATNVAREGNPLSAFIIKHFGIGGYYIFKMAIIPLLLAISYAHVIFWQFVVLALITAGAGWYAGISNYRMLRSKKITVF